MSGGTDDDLVERLLTRDEGALREVVDAHSAAVFGIARRILENPGLAEEVAQDTFLAMWRRPGAFDPCRGSLRGFLLCMARNNAIDLVRKEQRQSRTKDALMQEAYSNQSTIVLDDESVAGRDEVKTALACLSGVQKEALLMAFFGGRTYREVAEELGIPEGTAKTRMRDGLAALRRQMEGSRENDD
jgi:RNA polymerase sigma-70 factor (ECF subfamily)